MPPISLTRPTPRTNSADLHARPGGLPLTDDLLAMRRAGTCSAGLRTSAWGGVPLLGGKEFTTHGGLRAEDGKPIALGFHSGHWEVGLLVKAAAEEFAKLRCIPFAGAVTDPCDGRTQGAGNVRQPAVPQRLVAGDAAADAESPDTRRRHGRRHVRQGLPAMMMALASQRDHPTILVPGGVMLAGETGHEDTAKVQSIGARFAHGEITLDQAADPVVTRVPVPAAAASSSAPRRPPRSSARHSASVCRTRRCRRPASRSGSTWRVARHVHS